jgi:hypothetical protein
LGSFLWRSASIIVASPDDEAKGDAFAIIVPEGGHLGVRQWNGSSGKHR